MDAMIGTTFWRTSEEGC